VPTALQTPGVPNPQSTDAELTDTELTDTELTDTELTDAELTDAELTALALAADPQLPIRDDAVPLSIHLAQYASALPQWYMPPAMSRPGKWWRLPVIGTIVAAFLIIEGLGLCNTYGFLNFA
jgi:hypothetical protein